jgi:hypothetical protein
MSLVYCFMAGTLVEPDLWLPSDPFDHVWAMFGCNQLRCGACGQTVRSRVEQYCRRYECACQSRDEYGYHLIGSDAGQDREFWTAWRCAGHPPLPLPYTLDGIEIAAVAPFAAIVSQTLANPPFVAPGFRTQSFWVQRLYRLLPSPSQHAAVGHGVAAQLASPDPATARAAMDFFKDIPQAPGAEQVAVIAERDRDRLRATPDPASKTPASLWDRMLVALDARLVVVKDGAPVDRAALDLARRALLEGEEGDGLVFRIAMVDPIWYCEHAADIVRARPADIEFALEGLIYAQATDRKLALQRIRSLGRDAIRAVASWRKEHPELFGRR